MASALFGVLMIGPAEGVRSGPLRPPRRDCVAGTTAKAPRLGFGHSRWIASDLGQAIEDGTRSTDDI